MNEELIFTLQHVILFTTNTWYYLLLTRGSVYYLVFIHYDKSINILSGFFMGGWTRVYTDCSSSAFLSNEFDEILKLLQSSPAYQFCFTTLISIVFDLVFMGLGFPSLVVAICILGEQLNDWKFEWKVCQNKCMLNRGKGGGGCYVTHVCFLQLYACIWDCFYA